VLAFDDLTSTRIRGRTKQRLQPGRGSTIIVECTPQIVHASSPVDKYFRERHAEDIDRQFQASGIISLHYNGSFQTCSPITISLSILAVPLIALQKLSARRLTVRRGPADASRSLFSGYLTEASRVTRKRTAAAREDVRFWLLEGHCRAIVCYRLCHLPDEAGVTNCRL
jgi:hypothetical protein